MLTLTALTSCVQYKAARETTTVVISPTPGLSPTATASVAASVTPTPEAESSALTPLAEALSPLAPDSLELMIPVAGVRGSELRDTYNEARSEGRTHQAIDIIAPRGTPVVAAASGEIVKLFFSERGGNTIYQMSEDKKLVFYYAHLDRYAAGLTEGKPARQGEVIGYVGDTGNAVPGNYHLHFSIWHVTEPRHYWDGININPYPILRLAPTASSPDQLPRTANQKEQA
jgi:murein DD-endopeptidase MepM/ murein hydrolase activator NlpD